MPPSVTRSYVKWPIITTFAQGLAMMSTLILFLSVSKELSLSDIGHISLVVGLSSLAHQLTDAGYGNLMVRNSNQGGEGQSAVIWLVKIRLKRSIWVLPLVVSIALVNKLEPLFILTMLGLAFLNSLYSLAILAQNAKRNWASQTILQLSNFLGFSACALFFMLLDYQTVQVALLTYLSAWLLPSIVSICLLLASRKMTTASTGGYLKDKDARSFPRTQYFNLFTTMAIGITTTGIASELSGGYSQVQQIAMIFAPLSIAATNWFLPTLSRSSLNKVQITASKSVRLVIPMAILGAGLGWLFHIALTQYLDYGNLSQAALMLGMSASGLGVCTAILSTCFIAIGKAETGARLALIQAVLTIFQVLVAIWSRDLVTVMLVEFLIRVVGFSFLYRSYRKRIISVPERNHHGK